MYSFFLPLGHSALKAVSVPLYWFLVLSPGDGREMELEEEETKAMEGEPT